jgi:RIO-like serine/threonine protein kinase
MTLTRKDLEKGSMCVVKKGGVGKSDLSRLEADGQVLMIKDMFRKHFFVRWTLGPWLIKKEFKAYSRLTGIEGIPKQVQKIDRLAFAMEYIPGKPIQKGAPLSPSFYSSLDRLIRQVHDRGIVHMDLRHKGNILTTEQGEPYLIDFNSSFSFRPKGLLRRFLFPILRWVDYAGVLKLKKRISPELMTPEELASLERLNRIRNFWIFN